MRIAYGRVVGIALLTACASASRGGQNAKAIPVLTQSTISGKCIVEPIGSVTVERRSSGGTGITIADFSSELGRKAKAQGADAVLNAVVINQTVPNMSPTGKLPPTDGTPLSRETSSKYLAAGTMVRYLDAACSS